MMMSVPTVPPLLEAAAHRIVEAARHPEPLERVRAALRDCIDRFHAIGGLVHESAEDEVLLHADADLTIYHITLSPGLQYPPHNHLMHALVGIYSGAEVNLIYACSAGRIGTPTQHDITAPAVVHMEPHTVHAVANMGAARSGALHVYLGNLQAVPRQLWLSNGAEPEPFDNERYLAGARAIAAPARHL